MAQRLSLLRNGVALPEQVVADGAQLAGSANYLLDYVVQTLNLSPAQAGLIRPGFETLDLAIGDKIEDWNGVFLHVLDELREKGVQLEQRDALLHRMRRDGRTLLYRREVAEDYLLLTLREEHRGSGFGVELVDHDGFKTYNDRFGHAMGDLVLGTTGRLFRAHREGDIGARWGGDEYLRIVRNLVTPTQLSVVGSRDSELVASHDWEALDPRLRDTPPRLSLGLVYCERPSGEERARMKALDEPMSLQADQRFDPSVPVPTGSSFDLARRLMALADTLMYQAKASQRPYDPHIAQKNVRITKGHLMET